MRLDGWIEEFGLDWDRFIFLFRYLIWFLSSVSFMGSLYIYPILILLFHPKIEAF